MPAHCSPKPVRSHHLIAFVLFVLFFAQCASFIASVPFTQLEADQIARGVGLLRRIAPASEPASSPLVPLLSVAGIVFHLPQSPVLLDQFWLDQHRWFIRMPFLAAGIFLAHSLWYVARRLYGNAAGNVALALYAFSPGMIARSSLAGPHIFAAWGAFGLIFTAIATAHTLYAPREVILWNWKRITLLGISIAFAVGTQWPLAWLLIPAAAFMLWAVPHRRGAALLILLAAVAVSLVVFYFCYFANFGALAHGLAHAVWLGWVPQSVAPGLFARILGQFFFDSVPAALLAFPCAFVTWCAWPRTRFFGNTAPLIVLVLLLGMGMVLPQNGGGVILFAALPFVLLFIAGVFADLLESKLQARALAFIFAVIAAQATYSVSSLARMSSRVPGL
ncbi:MAG: hypothetical protein CXZ00_08490 [Acidobacteria bacterium]|nr:MAG: hypothetical protein CXZ00_08490 [Acidobacteriota bacterium]